MRSAGAILCFLVSLCLLSGLQAREGGSFYVLTDSLLPRSAQFSGRSYHIVSFRNTPDRTTLRDLQKQGIELLQFLGNRRYLCSTTHPLPENLILSQSPLRPEDKWHGEEFPPDKSSGLQKILLRYHEDIPEEQVLQLIAEQEIEVQQVFDLLPMLIVLLPADRLPGLLQQPWVQYAQAFPEAPTPDNLLIPAALTRAHQILKPNGLPYAGQNVLVAVGDDGPVGPHIDFQGRLKVSDESNSPEEGTHGDLVAGILAGAGNLLADYRGLAPQANLMVLDQFETILHASELHEMQHLMVTCTALSDGCNDKYGLMASLADRQLYQYPHLMHIFSAGNAGVEDCGYGAGAGWGNISGGVKLAKNTITVGNTNAGDELSASSSRGPASDGRIKPDLCAPGHEIGSTLPGHEYGQLNGTSASAPVVAGIYAQLVEAFRHWSGGEDPPSALLKAVLLNTAEDLGPPGPDFLHGFGRVNGLRAFQELKDGQYFQGGVNQDGLSTFSLNIPEEVESCRILLYWHDREASPFANSALVNDLHLKVTSPSGELILPLVPNHQPQPDLLMQGAQPGIDSVNNVEQVIIDVPEPGLYQLQVEGAEVPSGPQSFILTYSFRKKELDLTYPNGGESIPADSSRRLFWQASPGNQSFKISLSLDGGEEWTTLGHAEPEDRSFVWTAPSQISSRALLRVSRGNDSDQSDHTFTIGRAPEGLTIIKKCTEYAQLKWNALPGIERYIIYRLGETAMDSVLTVSDTTADVPIPGPLFNQWFAVSALIDSSGRGPRCRAILSEAGLYNCPVGDDIGILSINLPGSGVRPDCFSEPVQVSFTFKNYGILPQQGCCFYVQYDDLAPLKQCYTGIIPAGAPINLVMDSSLATGGPGLHHLKVWAVNPGDEVPQNDTLTKIVEVVPGQTVSLPYVEEFDDFPLCSTQISCDLSCELIDGWNNDTKGDIDQLDWRVHAGSTPTTMTGPDSDQNTFSETGRYLYLESSGNCPEKQAALLSPCIDLGGATEPVLTFWYHMYGETIGALYVDLYDGQEWILNIMPPLFGDQGNQWRQAMVPLGNFAGKTVLIRFRGYAEEGFYGDLAIDKFAVYDRDAPPIPAIYPETDLSCPGASVQFFDNSLNGATFWQWSFDPPLIQFQEGSTAESPNPVVTFSQAGAYLVTLTVSNSQGDTASTTIPYQVVNGDPPPILLDFESAGVSLPEGWSAFNPDNQIGWKKVEVTGKTGLSTQALIMNNHNYLEINEQDILLSPIIDLTNTEHPQLKFDLSYAIYNNNFLDRLLIRVLSDCGEPIQEIVFDQSGPELVTVAEKISGWSPTQPYHWGLRSVDLSSFAGRSIRLEFVNICGFGNNLYLDNIRIAEKDQFPDIKLNWSPAVTDLCQGDTLVVEASTDESILLQPLQWHFGEQALPNSASGPGPHKVVFPHSQKAVVVARAHSQMGLDQAFAFFQVIAPPHSDFSWEQNGPEFQFSNLSEQATHWTWHFGDGRSSAQKAPRHVYERPGQYLVRLVSHNLCGSDTSLMFADVITTEVSSAGKATPRWTIYPNPALDFIQLQTPEAGSPPLSLQIYDLQGIMLRRIELSGSSAGQRPPTIYLHDLPAGSYIARLCSGNQSSYQLFVLTH